MRLLILGAVAVGLALVFLLKGDQEVMLKLLNELVAVGQLALVVAPLPVQRLFVIRLVR